MNKIIRHLNEHILISRFEILSYISLMIIGFSEHPRKGEIATLIMIVHFLYVQFILPSKE